MVIPDMLRYDMSNAVHQPHLSEDASKHRAREILFWPGIDKETENGEILLRL